MQYWQRILESLRLIQIFWSIAGAIVVGEGAMNCTMKARRVKNEGRNTTRVSTAGQEKDGLSLVEQQRQCEKLLEVPCHEIKVYTDTGSGGGFEHRPGYKRYDVRNKTEVWDIVYVWKLDRLNRI